MLQSGTRGEELHQEDDLDALSKEYQRYYSRDADDNVDSSMIEELEELQKLIGN